MSVRVDEVKVYSWPDGWYVVRPGSDEAFSRLYGRLTHEARRSRTSFTNENWELHRNKKGEGGTVFLVRPLPVPAGARTTSNPVDRMNSVVMGVYFERSRDGERWVPNVWPGAYRPFVLEGFCRLLGLFLSLETSLSEFFFDRKERFPLPIFGGPSGGGRNRHLERFIEHVAAATAGVNVATDWDSTGYLPQKDSEFDLGKERTSGLFFSTSRFEVASTYRHQAKGGLHRFTVEVDLPIDSWDCLGDEAKDVRGFLEETPRPSGGSKVEKPFPVPREAPSVPWRVTNLPWGDVATSTSLLDALVEAGVVARHPEDFRAFVHKKAIIGEMYSNSDISLLLGLMPELFTCPLGQVIELAESYGVSS